MNVLLQSTFYNGKFKDHGDCNAVAFLLKMISEKTVSKYCCEDLSKIENYDKAVADETQIWHCHHRLEIQGEFRNSFKLLKKCGLYYNVPAWQLIFLTKSEHRRLHMLGKKYTLGKHHSAESKLKIREAQLGEKNNMFGKHHSAEAKQKNREAHLGKHHSGETKQKIGEAKREQLWWNNGVINKRSKECPGPDWKRGRLKASKI